MIELITGKAAEAHISSNDDRAFHRANFGQGKYIFEDADNMAVSVTATSGTITILAGSCLWSGMHIRISEPETLSYVVPAASQTVRVYLHYTKDAETLDEAVEFAVATDAELTPIIDNMSDNTLEAYTLFCSFTATATAISGVTSGFSAAVSHEALEQLVADAHEEKILFSGEAVVGSTINLSESFKNFHELEFYSSESYETKRVLVSNIPEVGNNLGVALTGANRFSNATTTYMSVISALFSLRSETELYWSNGYQALIGSSVASGGEFYISKIIGIGRKR